MSPRPPIGSPIAREQERGSCPNGQEQDRFAGNKGKLENCKMVRRTSKSTNADKSIRSDVYQRITDKIVAQLEQGTRPWFKPWKGGAPCRPLRHNGQPYRGINVVVLWMEAEDRGYSSPYWMTYKQAQELGGQVKKGEKSALVVYANTFEKKEEDPETGEERETRIPFMKGYSVFNADQIEGLPEQFHVAAEPDQPENQFARIEAADRFFENLGADIRSGGGRAFYSPSGDFGRYIDSQAVSPAFH
ncbi:MAG: ArdC-like ssDNA-binding domain-containing protein [Martelella sp.]|uniref:ArdC family protein n=1 Tax=Martelella sp. TaxID=1969699 RepID=UPI003242C1B3